MSFSFNPKQELHSGPLMSEEIKNVQQKLAQMMQKNQKTQNKRSEENSLSPSREQNDDIDQKYSQSIKNSFKIPDEELVSQTQNLMQDIIKVMKDQDLQNQIQILTDQDIAKPLSHFDLQNMINRMHKGISIEQQRMLQARNNLNESRNNYSMNQNNISFNQINMSAVQNNNLNKSANFGKSKSRSPALSSRTQTIIHKKQMMGEYKPIHERVDEIMQHQQESIQKISRAFPKKEEPIPTFQPQINKNSAKMVEIKQRQDFLTEMKGKDEQKEQKIRQKQEEKEICSKQIYTFQPLINPSTTQILEKSQVFSNDYDPQNMQNVVNRLYSRMKEKQQRDKERQEIFMSYSPFKPKINQNSEKLFFKGSAESRIVRLDESF